MAIVLGGVVLSTVVSSATAWYLSMNKTMSGTNDRLEAMTIAMSEWQRLEHMSLDELEANRENYKNPYDVGEKFKVGVTLGEQGFFDEGKCNSLTGTYAGENANCFKDTTMTVYDKDGNAMYTTRSLPLSVSRDSFPEGTILPYTGDLAKIPHGWVLCDGTNGTPDLRGRFLEGTGSYSGEFKAAGLPNITGMIKNDRGIGYLLSNALEKGSSFGALYLQDASINFDIEGAALGGHSYDFGIDASRSNPIYGRANTVQPPSYTVFYIMKTNQDFHYNHTNPADTPSFYTKEEVDQLLEDERKNVANNYLNKSSKEYVHNLSHNYGLSMAYNSDDKMLHGYVDGVDIPFASQSGGGKNIDYNHYINYPWSTSLYNSTLTAPDDGVFSIITTTSNETTADIIVNGVTVYNQRTGADGIHTTLLPVSKGDRVTFKTYYNKYYSYGHESEWEIRFFYYK